MSKIHKKIVQEKHLEINRNLKVFVKHETIDKVRKEKFDRVEEANRKFRENYSNYKSPTNAKSSPNASRKISFAAISPRGNNKRPLSHQRNKSPRSE